MILVPYLSPRVLAWLESEGISGIDACGNGVITVAGRLLVYRTGKRNEYPDSAPIKNVFRGDASLVTRALVRIPKEAYYKRVSDIRDQILAYGGKVALSTVSKVLKRLEEDLLIERSRGRIRWLQGDELLDRLAQNYEPPRLSRRIRGKCRLMIEEMSRRLSAMERRYEVRIAATGLTSVSRYAVMAKEEKLSVYCSDASVLFTELRLFDPDVFEATDLFANLELLETRTQYAFFDPQRDEDGFPWASPVQTYLELMSGGKREQETAQQVADAIVPLMTDWNKHARWAVDT
jgi:hypothetical protein